jgi:folate-binding Fe-S cluster repair protein YgfZ
MLHLDGSEDSLPGAGAAVRTAERDVGHVTTAARHYELGPIALALIKRNTPVDAPLEAAGIPAAQEVICAP